ncbi:hypothetical protein J2W46_006559 [Paraburkholderia strydomiana]|nr:hypothetical protein [Paraburkholderia strydomiana]
MNRRRPGFQSIHVGTWPTVTSAELDEAARRDFEARRQAVVRFAAGESVATIEQATGVNRRQLYRCIERAMLPHPDGRPFGFRALVPYMRIAEYVRIHHVRVHGEGGSRGAAGALSCRKPRYAIASSVVSDDSAQSRSTIAHRVRRSACSS